MPPSSSPIGHPLAESADTIQTIQLEEVRLRLPFGAEFVGLTVSNFFPIVVFYLMGALIGCYAPVE